MRNRDLIINKVEKLEGFHKTLEYMVKNGSPIPEFLDFLSRSEDTLSEIKSMIEREDMTANELNKY